MSYVTDADCTERRLSHPTFRWLIGTGLILLSMLLGAAFGASYKFALVSSRVDENTRRVTKVERVLESDIREIKEVLNSASIIEIRH